jgi:hypothetical protein
MLEENRRRLLSEDSSCGLLEAIRRTFDTSTDNIYIVDHINEQAEDIFEVLVDGRVIVQIEVPRYGERLGIVLDRWLVEPYRRNRLAGKWSRHQFELALSLARGGES